MYVAWLVFDAAKLALVGLVLVDALLDFRSRWAAAGAARTPGAPTGGASDEAERSEDRRLEETRTRADSDGDPSGDSSDDRCDRP